MNILKKSKIFGLFLFFILSCQAQFNFYDIAFVSKPPVVISPDLVWSELTEGSNTDNNPSITSTISPTPNSDVFCSVIVAKDSETVSGDSMTISGCNLTWTLISRVNYSTRRTIYVFHGTSATPSSGTVSISFTASGGTWTEHMWSISQVVGAAEVPYSNVGTSVSVGSTTLATTVGGTVNSGDNVYAVFGIELGSASATVEDGSVLTNLGGGTDGRTIVTFYDSTVTIDQTPSISWSSTDGAGGIAFIVKKL